MASKILVPSLGESVTEGIVAAWLKQPGEAVGVDEVVMELETDKVTIEVLAPEAGTLASHEVGEGDTVEPGAVLGLIDAGAGAGAAPADAAPAAEAPKLEEAPAAPASEALSPAVEKLAAENPQIDPASLDGSGKDGRVTKGDMLAA
ncbi:MAG: biotin/lipoyl-containing protein, partial [Pseudomonadota bacterium]